MRVFPQTPLRVRSFRLIDRTCGGGEGLGGNPWRRGAPLTADPGGGDGRALKARSTLMRITLPLAELLLR